MLKNFIRLTLLVNILSAQPAIHSVTLSWSSDESGATYNVYKSSGPCSSGQIFTKIATSVATTTYTDTTPTVGDFCYQVTNVINGLESPPDTMGITVKPRGPKMISISAK